ncbi:hypothetical protein H0H93_010437 [Arthromyces matolae]|nr:hypothetical protein H0H93_010437 [Arthromyces matolae]
MRPHLPVFLAARIAVLCISLLFVIPDSKALPLPPYPPTQHSREDDLRWVQYFNGEDERSWEPPVWDWEDYDPALYCGNAFAEESSIQTSSPSGEPLPSFQALPPTPRPKKLRATHKAKSLTTEVLPKDPSKAPLRPAGKRPPGNRPHDTKSQQATLQTANEKWLTYLSEYDKYAEFLHQYQQNLEEKKAELTQIWGTKKVIDQKLECYQISVFKSQQKAGKERMKKLKEATTIKQDDLMNLEQWERSVGDDKKDSELQKSLKQEEEKYQVQAIAANPMHPKELDHDQIEMLKVMFRMKRKLNTTGRDRYSDWEKWRPEEVTVMQEDHDVFLENFNGPEIEPWIKKWWERVGNRKPYLDALKKIEIDMTNVGRKAEIPSAVEAYKAKAWIRDVEARRSRLIEQEKIRKGARGYSKADRDRINEWEILRGDQSPLRPYLNKFARRREQDKRIGVYTEMEIDNFLWRDRGSRMVETIKKTKKRKHHEILPWPKLMDFQDSEAALWRKREEFQSSVLIVSVAT